MLRLRNTCRRAGFAETEWPSCVDKIVDKSRPPGRLILPHCKNYVTFVGQLLGRLTVCGTNAYSPGCWTMDGENFPKLTHTWTEQLAPRTPGTNYNILITGDQVYSTLPRKSNNAVSVMKTLFRKISGSDPLLYTGDKFLRHPEFVKSLVVEKEDKVQSKILLFFTEDNIESRTVEKRLPMVAQLCKNEAGSAKANTRNIFSTALKSRMICGNHLTEQYYPHLQDIYFLQGKTGNVIYGLFKNSWNHSAVCSYNVEDIELLFNTSSLMDSSKKDLKIRPGTCLPSRELTPEETSEEAFSHPELTEWLWPSQNRTVFQHVDHYRKVVVDEITAVNQKTYRVLILAKDNGTAHKVVELEDGAINILEVIPFKQEGKLQFMKLEPNQHVVYMGTTREIARFSLDDCAAYNNSCTDCIQSRDPFCGWIDGKCESILNSDRIMVHQDLKQNATCIDEKKATTEYRIGDTATNDIVYNEYFLTCPTLSNRANYISMKDNMEAGTCNPSNEICKLRINVATDHREFKCTAREMKAENGVSESNSATKCIWFLVFTVQLLIVI
ncbi:hypothetical protein GDO78_005517 [Eleutherodactylus coqui]|uniref:Sema domain-containing protein n=2 Tax=Eleutherodactylus coqui TaxID=57060 RepID=A0A8J6FKF5_ELECQ|nr:hypothetical protein GDO78_005517 [Eleutherodactylus coqui]